MAVIAPTSMNQAGAVNPTQTTLDGTDSFVYTSGLAVLVLRNSTGGSVTPVIDGDGSTTVPVTGVPDGVDVSAGYSVGSIPDGESRAIKLDTISAYLSGTIAVNSGIGLVAELYTF